jgi:hypothetical protein
VVELTAKLHRPERYQRSTTGWWLRCALRCNGDFVGEVMCAALDNPGIGRKPRWPDAAMVAQRAFAAMVAASGHRKSGQNPIKQMG